MPVIKIDIRKYKNKLRKKYKNIRNNLSNKSKLDETIFDKVVSLESYKKSNFIIAYVSTKIEVDTRKIIEFSLSQGKKVAVPKCIDGTRNMDFYFINSFDDLETGTFSVLEPKHNLCVKVENFKNSICIVPGLAFDGKGYRLGYGKGYYDRFLNNYKGKKIGLCYCRCTLNSLIVGKFDKHVDLLITEKYIRRIT